MSTQVASLDEIMGAVAAQLETELATSIEGIQIESKLVPNPTPPCIDIYPADPFSVPASFGPAAWDVVFTVRTRVVTADNEGGQELLLDMMDPRSDLSLSAALASDSTFGGVVDDSSVETVSGFQPYEPAGSTVHGYNGSLLGAEWRLRVSL